LGDDFHYKPYNVCVVINDESIPDQRLGFSNISLFLPNYRIDSQDIIEIIFKIATFLIQGLSCSGTTAGGIMVARSSSK